MVPRKIPAFDSSAKDFLLRKDVPENKNVNGKTISPDDVRRFTNYEL